jgi:ComF family protein
VLAPTCALCGALIPHLRQGAVCEDCWLTIRVATAPAREPTAHASSPIDLASAIGDYDGPLRDVIHALKYGRRPSIAIRLGRLMRTHGVAVLTGADVVIPVPLHWTRRSRRGFNQAALLAAQLGLPVEHRLRRIRRTVTQVTLPADTRHDNVAGAFALRWRDAHVRRSGWRATAISGIAGRIIVLVDDVSTTGATLEACALVLKAAGAKEVRALTAARVVRRRR